MIEEAIVKLSKKEAIGYVTAKEVMNEISDNFLSDINTYLSGILASERKDHERHLVLLFQYMENHLLLSRTMLNNITDPRFSVKLMNLPAVLEMGKLLRPGISGALHVFVRSYILGGCYSILKDWINSDDRVSANEAVSIMITLVRNSYKGLL